MEVWLTPDQEAFIRQAIASGRYQTPEEAVRDAMARWEESERARIELLTALDDAEGDLATAQYTDWTSRRARPSRFSSADNWGSVSSLRT